MIVNCPSQYEEHLAHHGTRRDIKRDRPGSRVRESSPSDRNAGTFGDVDVRGTDV